MIKAGNVYWISGLAGAGKTTIAEVLLEKLRVSGRNVVHFDGDDLRKVFNNSSYVKEERVKLGLQYGRLCSLVSEQGMDVICSTISMYAECWEWNRSNIPNYFDIFLSVTEETLLERDKKGLYSGSSDNVAGVDLAIDEPLDPFLLIQNDGIKPPDEIADQIISVVAEAG